MDTDSDKNKDIDINMNSMFTQVMVYDIEHSCGHLQEMDPDNVHPHELEDEKIFKQNLALQHLGSP